MGLEGAERHLANSFNLVHILFINIIIILDYILQILAIKGLTIKPRRSRIHSTEYLTDLDFAGDPALISESIRDRLIQSLEYTSSQVRLALQRKQDRIFIYLFTKLTYTFFK